MSATKDLREVADVVKEAADFLGTVMGQLPRQPLADELGGCAHWLRETAADLERPIDMVLHCPECGAQHIDEPEPSMQAGDAAMMGGDWPGRWTNPPHRTHLCHSCDHKWRPADVATNGVAAVKTRGKDDSPIATPLWFLADESTDAQDDVWMDAADAYNRTARGLRGHLEWRDKIRAAVRVLLGRGAK